MDHVTSELCHKLKEKILQRNYRKINSFVKFQGKKIWESHNCACLIQICVITRSVIKGHYSVLTSVPGQHYQIHSGLHQ